VRRFAQEPPRRVEERGVDCGVARGTGAPRLLNAGLSLAEIANHMVWSVRDAANVIEDHAGVSPDEIDGVLVKPAHAKRAEG